MASNEKLQVLLERLITSTRAGTVTWKRTIDHDESYEWGGTEGDRIVVDSRDDDGQAPYDLLVIGADGQLVTEVKWSVDRMTHPVTPMDEKLVELYELARDHVSGANEVIDRLLRDLPDADADIPF